MNKMPLDDARHLASDVLGLDGTLLSLTPDDLAAPLPDLSWDSSPKWESLDDIEIARTTGLPDRLSDGTLVVITEACLIRGGEAFVLHAHDLTNFVERHLKTQGEAFFNGDVVILSPDAPAIWPFHHDGLFAYIPLTWTAKPRKHRT